MKIESQQFVELAKTLFDQGLAVVTVAKGGSMRPCIEDGMTVRIEPVVPKLLRLGDVVLFELDPNGTVIHRVARFCRRRRIACVQTWGDRMQKPDTPVPLSKVIGKVSAVRKGNQWQSLRFGPRCYIRYCLHLYGPYYLRRFVLKLLNKFGLATNYSKHKNTPIEN